MSCSSCVLRVLWVRLFMDLKTTNSAWLTALGGGDRRSIGRSNQAVAQVLRRPELFAHLMSGLSHRDRLIRMRSADAMEKVTLRRPELLAPHRARLLSVAL